jgi:hypothetical protein
VKILGNDLLVVTGEEKQQWSHSSYQVYLYFFFSLFLFIAQRDFTRQNKRRIPLEFFLVPQALGVNLDEPMATTTTGGVHQERIPRNFAERDK